jgi:hypothetical protein
MLAVTYPAVLGPASAAIIGISAYAFSSIHTRGHSIQHPWLALGFIVLFMAGVLNAAGYSLSLASAGRKSINMFNAEDAALEAYRIGVKGYCRRDERLLATMRAARISALSAQIRECRIETKARNEKAAKVTTFLILAIMSGILLSAIIFGAPDQATPASTAVQRSVTAIIFSRRSTPANAAR